MLIGIEPSDQEEFSEVLYYGCALCKACGQMVVLVLPANCTELVAEAMLLDAVKVHAKSYCQGEGPWKFDLKLFTKCGREVCGFVALISGRVSKLPFRKRDRK